MIDYTIIILGGKNLTIVKILFALLVVFPVAALSYYFLKRLVDELYDKK